MDRLLQAVEADPSRKRALLRRMGIEDQACDRTLSGKRGGTSEETPSGTNAGPCWPQQTFPQFPFPPPFWWPQPRGNCPPYAGACAWDQATDSASELVGHRLPGVRRGQDLKTLKKGRRQKRMTEWSCLEKHWGSTLHSPPLTRVTTVDMSHC